MSKEEKEIKALKAFKQKELSLFSEIQFDKEGICPWCGDCGFEHDEDCKIKEILAE